MPTTRITTPRECLEWHRDWRPIRFSKVRNPEEHYSRLWRDLQDQAEAFGGMHGRNMQECLSLANHRELELTRELMLIPDDPDQDQERTR